MSNFNIIFYGLCALVPRLPKGENTYSGVTVLLPSVPKNEAIDKDKVRLSKHHPKIPYGTMNIEHVAKLHIKFNGGKPETIDLSAKEVKILINGSSISGDVKMKQGVEDSRYPTSYIADLNEIYSDEGGIHVKDDSLTGSLSTNGLASRVNIHKGELAAYSATIDGNPTMSADTYLFYDTKDNAIGEAKKLAGAAIFTVDLTGATKITIQIDGMSKNYDPREGDLELMFENMPPDDDNVPTQDFTDADFLLVYKVADIKSNKKLRPPHVFVKSRPFGPRPPAICGLAFYGPK